MYQATCQRCKNAVATVHLTEIDRGEKQEKHLCERCAAEEGIKVQQHPASVNELLTQFVLQQSGAQQISHLACEPCGCTFAEFRKIGVLGCPACYDALEKALVPLLERAHGGNARHIGKAPRRREGQTPDPAHEIARLRHELALAVEREDFERAAEVRDNLKTMGIS
ncbi:MAG: UvrB/UvrC motif-containing protein [Phycisphaerae bacterium]